MAKDLSYLDGYTYLGLFPALFVDDTPCRGCGRGACALLAVIGHGDIHTFPVCGTCGALLDARLRREGFRKPISRPARIAPERRQEIATAEGPVRVVARRFGVDPKTVREYRRERQQHA